MTTSIDSLIARPAAWLSGPGIYEGVVMSTRIRLARNCTGFNFRRTLNKTRQRELVEHLMLAMSPLSDLRSATHVRLDELAEIQRQVLIERQLVSRELASGKHPAAVSISADQVVSVMMNEEDHVRLQVINAGFCVSANLERAIRVDTDLEQTLGWAFHERFGYLTACPTNVGTGMRASAMLHLPALAESGEMKTALRGLVKLNMTVRGLHGEGSEPSGHCFQISNQRSLGITEGQIVEQLSEAVEQMVAYERAARQTLLENSRWRLEDKIFRAWGVLSQARTLTGDDLMTELSWIRLGSAMGLLEWKNWKMMDQLFLDGQPAHLQLRHGEVLDESQRDRLRADLVRKALTVQDIQRN